MNRHCHRIVFNSHRGQLMAVAETAQSGGKGTKGEGGSKKTSPSSAKLRCFIVSLWLGLGVMPIAWTQIIADPAAPANQRPTVLSDSTGRPLVNIQTPSAAGLSRNTYRQFDVPNTGIVLNNSSNNPWLSNAVLAKTILNEVNSSNPSFINGSITVNGAAAQVIVANPNGITINGSGFVNASRATLTTGTAQVINGALTGFNIRGGGITLDAGGLNNSATPYTDIMSRTVMLTGTLRAQNLGITTGLQSVEYATGIISNQDTSNYAAGALAIDTAALGGMYAGNISILSTEAGLGVRNQGTWQATGGQIVVTTDGLLQNMGAVSGSVISLATVNGHIENTGNLQATQAVMTSSGGDTRLFGPGLKQTDGSAVVISAKGSVNLYNNPSYGPAQIASTSNGGQVSVSAGGNINLNTGTFVAADKNVAMDAAGQILATNARITSIRGDVLALSKQGISLNNTTITGEQVHIETGATFSDTAADILVQGGNIWAHTQATLLASGSLAINGMEQAALRELDAKTQEITLSNDTSNKSRTYFFKESPAVTVSSGAESVMHALRPGQTLYVRGGGNVDKVYVGPGTSADLRYLLGGRDMIYFSGRYAEYAKSMNVSGSILFTRDLANGTSESALTGSGHIGSTRDLLVFSDGSIATNILKTALLSGQTPVLDTTVKSDLADDGFRIRGGSVVSSAGNVHLQAAKAVDVADSSTVTAGQNMSVMAGTNVILRALSGSTATNGQKVSLIAGGNTLVAGNTVTAVGTSIKAGQVLAVQANDGNATLWELSNAGGTSVDKINLQAGTDLNVSVFKGDLFARGLHASGQNINLLSNGITSIASATNQDGSNIQAVPSILNATDDLVVGSINTNNGSNSQVQVVASTLSAGGQAKLLSNGIVLITATSDTVNGVSTPARSSITAGSVVIQGGTVQTAAADIRTNGDKSTATKSGDINVTATSGNALFNVHTNVRSQFNSTGNIALHANGNLTHLYTQANSGGGLSSTSATDVINSFGSNLVAKDVLSFASKGAQTHTSGYYSGGAATVFNETGHLALNSTRVQAVGATVLIDLFLGPYPDNHTHVQQLVPKTYGGQTSITSGGTLGLDAASILYAKTDLSVIQGQGDITINPTELERGTLSTTQLGYGRDLTLVTRNGNMLLSGADSTGGLDSSQRVRINTPGKLTLSANNLSLKGSVLQSQGGDINLTATSGHINIATNHAGTYVYDPLFLGPIIVTTNWEPTVLISSGDISLRASGNLNHSRTLAKAAGNLSNTSANGEINSTGTQLFASNILSFTSKYGQTHYASNYFGGATSIFNETGQLEISDTRVEATGIDANNFSRSGKTSIESGGTLHVNSGSVLTGASDLAIIQGLGDINLNPSGSDRRTFALNQLRYSRNLTLGTRNGNMTLHGTDGNHGYGSSDKVVIATPGSLSLFAKNIHLQGSHLLANGGALNLTATDGNLTVEANKVSHYNAGFNNTHWDDASLTATTSMYVRASGDMQLNGMFASAGGNANFQSGGNLTATGKVSRWQMDHRLSAGSSFDGWYQDDESVNYTRISGYQGVNLGAMGGHLRLSGSNISANSGTVTLQALGNVQLEAVMTDRVNAKTSTGRDETCIRLILFSICAKETWTTYHNRAWRDVNAVSVNARDIDIKAGNDVKTYASNLNASNNLKIEAGDQALYHAVKNETDHTNTTYSRKSFIGIRYDKDTEHNTTRISTPVVSYLYATDGNLTSYSGGDQLFQGTVANYSSRDIQAGVGEKARSDARIILEGVKTTVFQQRTQESNYVVWQKTQDQGSVTETLSLPSFTGKVNTPFKAPGGISVQIPDGDFKSQINTLSQQPGMGYLNDLAARSDVNWQPVKLAHESWNYQHQGLTPAGAALLAVAVTWATGGAGAGLVGGTVSTTVAGVTTVTTTTAGLAANAAFSSLAAQASISLINNKGDIGKTLKELGSSQTVKTMLIAAGVAGVTSYTDTWGNTLTSNGNKIVTDWAKRSQAIMLNTAAKGALTGANSNSSWWTIAALGMAGEAYQYWVGRGADVRPGVDRENPEFKRIDDEGGSGLYRVPRVDVNEVLKREGKNIGLNQNPCTSITQICHGTSISNALNTLPGFNAFATLHDTWMNNPGFMNTATSLGTMPPALMLTYGALLDQYRYINSRRR